MKEIYRAGIIVTSDSCHVDNTKDLSGAFIESQLKTLSYISSVEKIIIPDERQEIMTTVKKLVNANVHLIITCGGTGLCPRDQTPQACESLYHISCPGIAMALMMNGLRYSPHAAISRLTAGIIDKTLIVNFPGKLRACKECFECLEPLIEHSLDQINFNPEAIKKTHMIQDAIPKNDTTPSPVDMKMYSSRTDQSSSSHLLNHKVNENISNGHQCSVQSSYDLIEFKDALNLLRHHSSSLLISSKEVKFSSHDDLDVALDDILANDIRSTQNLPKHPVSTMDGFVLNLSERMANKVKSLGTIIATITSGLDEFELMQASNAHRDMFFCYQVNTGGRVPKANFTVIPFENTGSKRNDSRISIHRIQQGKYVRRMGSDMDLNDYLPKGTKLGPIEISTILSMGHRNYDKLVMPLIGIISTGDEIVDPLNETTTRPDECVIDLNGPTLRTLFKKFGLQSVNLGIVKDDPKEILLKLNDGLQKCDILIVTGGASMGTRDYVKKIIEDQLRGTIHFGRINIKPGKPASFATIDGMRARFIFSLPGNPVSAYVTASVLAIPFIRYSMLRYLNKELPEDMSIIGTIITVEIGLINDLDATDGQSYVFDGRLEFVRAKLIEPADFSIKVDEKTADDRSRHIVSVSAKQESSRLLSLLDFNCLILVDPSMKHSRFLVGQTYQAVLVKY